MDNYQIEQIDDLPTDIESLIHQGHVKDEANHRIACNYKKLAILIKNANGAVIGALQAYTAFAEVYVDDIWVDPLYRGQNLGRKLLKELENKFKDQGYNNINLVTSHFQAPEFYKKCGFETEFVRINHKNPQLSKTFYIKYFDDENQHQGIIACGQNAKD
jgi:ribosomal protein S18 acetylase RimI-like enzyme